MKRKKMLFLLNPHSGKGQIKNKLLEIVDLFVKNDYEVTIHTTQAPQEAIRIVEKRACRFDIVVCSGGDGTLDETVSGMMKSTESCVIGYIPAGSTNDFANSIGIPKDLVKAAQAIVDGVPFACDIGRMNDNFFVYIAAFGLFTDVSYGTPQEWKNLLGHAAYILGGMKSLHSIKAYPMRMECNGEVVEGEFIYGMVTNSTSVGGFKNMAGTNVLLDDGLFEVTMIKKPRNPMELSEIIRSLTNLIDNTELIYSTKTSEITIHSIEPVAWTIDGEYGGDHVTVLIENENRAVNLMRPIQLP